MASPFRSADLQRGNGGPEPINSHQMVLQVAPLNSMPYIGPPVPVGNRAGDPTQGDVDAKPVEEAGPSMVFLPSHKTQQERDNILNAARSGVVLTGSAAMGEIGPILGRLDIGECDDAYLFRVSLPGVANDDKDFSCDIEPDGTVLIKGVTTTGESTVCKFSEVFRMQTQNLCPPGHFSITFQLPGPVDPQQFTGSFGIDGILEGIIKKKQ